jgi:biopolymer transport protein ExbB/TolQ
MPQVTFLFDRAQDATDTPDLGVFRSLLTAIPTEAMLDCALYHGPGGLGQYIVVIYSHQPGALRDAATRFAALPWKLPSPPNLSFSDVPPPAELVFAGRVGNDGRLLDSTGGWLDRIWNEVYAGSPRAETSPALPVANGMERLEPEALPHPGSSAPGPETAPPPVLRNIGSWQSRVNLPRTVPAVLTEAADPSRKGALLGCAASALISGAIFLAAPKASVAHRIFDLTSAPTAIPVAVLAMFFWGMYVCWFRWRRLTALEGVSDRSLLQMTLPFLNDAGVAATDTQMSGPMVQVSPLLRRMKTVLHQWNLRPSLQDADVVLQQATATDDEATYSGYSLVRTFVWALPVLGLIGTVIGISLAVGGFGKLLSGNTNEIAAIKRSLVDVTGGLSFAFLITLEGLLTSLVMMLAASSLQTRERELFARVQHDVGDVLLPALQHLAPEVAVPGGLGGPLPEDFADILARRLVGEARDLYERISNDAGERHRQWSMELARAGDDFLKASGSAAQREWHIAQERTRLLVETLAGGVQTMAKGFEESLARSGSEFIANLDRVRELFAGDFAAHATATATAHVSAEAHLRAFSEVIRERQAAFAEEISADREASAARAQALLAGLTAQVESANAGFAGVASLAALNRDALLLQQSLHDTMRTMDGPGLRMTFEELTGSLERRSDEIRDLCQTIKGLGELTQQVVLAQTSLQASTRHLAESDFNSTLNRLRESLTTLGPVLENFQRPFVFQAVPVAAGGK